EAVLPPGPAVVGRTGGGWAGESALEEWVPGRRAPDQGSAGWKAPSLSRAQGHGAPIPAGMPWHMASLVTEPMSIAFCRLVLSITVTSMSLKGIGAVWSSHTASNLSFGTGCLLSA